ncbi:MAG: 4a-hydroxytetrahydrobiopterin dehydratase [Actinomycetota bacterium]
MAARNEEALARGLPELPGWQRHGDGIWKTYELDDFASAALFVGRVADATAATGHQPDIAIRGGRVTLELTPRTGSTLTDDDLMVAERIQRLVGDHHRPGRPGRPVEPERPPDRHPATPGGPGRPVGRDRITQATSPSATR